MKVLDELQADAIGHIYGMVCKKMFELLCEKHPFKSRDKILQDVLSRTYSQLEMDHYHVMHQRTNSP